MYPEDMTAATGHTQGVSYLPNESLDIDAMLARLDQIIIECGIEPATQTAMPVKPADTFTLDAFLKAYRPDPNPSPVVSEPPAAGLISQSFAEPVSAQPEACSLSAFKTPDELFASLGLNAKSRSAAALVQEHTPAKPTRRVWKIVSECLFYATLIAVVAVVFMTADSGGNAPRSLFGYTVSTVLSGSMQSELPKDSIIVTKKVDTGSLVISDNITFITKDNTTVTHKIVGIYENHDGSGQRAFVTQGTENGLADDDLVYASNVVGKVVWHSVPLGNTFVYLKQNIFFVGVMAVLCIGFFIAARMFIASGKKKTERSDDHANGKSQSGSLITAG